MPNPPPVPPSFCQVPSQKVLSSLHDARQGFGMRVNLKFYKSSVVASHLWPAVPYLISKLHTLTRA